MKRLIALICLIAAAQLTYAKCGSNGIYLLSQYTTLNKNGLIVLEFYGSSQSLIPDLNKKYPIYLQSGKEKITLIPVEVLKGEFQVTQVVLKATTELVAKKQYKLQLDNLPSYERKPQSFNTAGRADISFTVNDVMDIQSPVAGQLPVVKKRTMVEYGCGPSRWVYVAFSGKDQSELFVKARVKNKNTGKTTDYILTIENGMVKIGHGMCSGPFHFDNSDSFEVSFQLYDQSGNTTAFTKAISIDKPTVSGNEE